MGPFGDPEVEAWIVDEDQGIGLPLHKIPELNARLAKVPVLGVEATEQMGFHVVALLARRLGALIQLQPRQGGGTVAVVVIPGTLSFLIRHSGTQKEWITSWACILNWI